MSLFSPPDGARRAWPAARPPVMDDGVGRPVTPQVQAGDREYAVLVVSESQLDSLLGRPALRHLNSRLIAARGRAGWRWRMAAGAATLLACGVVIGGLAGAPRPGLASVLPERVLTWARPPVAPPLLTSAGFSLALAAPRSGDAASSVLSRLQDLGLPAFAEPVVGSPAHQVFVGPYASLDEAEGVQRRLSRAGFGGPRLAVDDSLRHVARADAGGAVRRGETGVLLIGASGRVSLVLELATTPRQVVAQQTSETVLDVDIAPAGPGVRGRDWSAPAGVHLVEHVSILEGPDLDGERSLRARVTIPPSARATARVEGRRVYVDLAWPEAVTAASRPRPAAPREPAAAATTAATTAPAPAPAADLTPLREAAARFQEMVPFLVSAANAPEPAVLRALDGTLSSLGVSLADMAVPADARAARDHLAAAVASARRAVDPLGTGDRLAHAHQAIGFFEAARGFLEP
jgi:cell division septation protein DedD